MKNTNLKFLTLSALLAASVPLRAADPVEVPWNDFCRVAQQRQLEITTADGGTVTGYCISINADEVGIGTSGKVVKLGRAALSRIQVERSQGGQLRSLGRGMHTGLKNGFNWLLSPAALGGIVTIPAVLVWGAASAPFCALGDLKHHALGKEEIKLI